MDKIILFDKMQKGYENLDEKEQTQKCFNLFLEVEMKTIKTEKNLEQKTKMKQHFLMYINFIIKRETYILQNNLQAFEELRIT
jgi:hypothetical protein